MNLHIKCLIFEAKNDGDTESHHLYTNDRMNLQDTAENAECCRFYLTLGGDVHLV